MTNSQFRELVKRKRTEGEGIFSSLLTASSEISKEKRDIRNFLFKRGSWLNALFPSVSGYKTSKTGKKLKDESASVGGMSSLQNEKLNELVVKIDIVAKNSMALPVMMRDMNVVKQSMMKLVKLQGVTQRDRADRFFLSAKEREEKLEAEFDKRKSKKSELMQPKEKTTKSGVLGPLFSGFKTLTGGVGSIIGSIFSGIAGTVGVAGRGLSLSASILGSLGFIGIILALAASSLITALFSQTDFSIFGRGLKQSFDEISKGIKSFFGLDADSEKSFARQVTELLDKKLNTTIFTDSLNAFSSSLNGIINRMNRIFNFLSDSVMAFGKDLKSIALNWWDENRTLIFGAIGAGIGAGVGGAFGGIRGAAIGAAAGGAAAAAGAWITSDTQWKSRQESLSAKEKTLSGVEKSIDEKEKRLMVLRERGSSKGLIERTERELKQEYDRRDYLKGQIDTLKSQISERTGGNLERLWFDEKQEMPKTERVYSATGNTSSLFGSGILSTVKNNAEPYDGNMQKILNTIKIRESGGNYKAQNPGSSASGAYQFMPKTWQALTKKFGIGREYMRAKDAPPEIQDAVAAAYIKDILKRSGGDVSKVPLEWYTGNLEGKMTEKQLTANKGLSSQQYQAMWMSTYTGKKIQDTTMLAQNQEPKMKGDALNSMSGNWLSFMKNIGSTGETVNIVNNNVTGGQKGGSAIPAMIASVVDEDMMKLLTEKTYSPSS
jgi:outer membrane lipoprotein SlyB